MSTWGVQLAIGKLITDEDLRRRFEQRPADSLAELRGQGVDLDDEEIAALLNTDRRLWSGVAAKVDATLRSIAPLPQFALTGREKQVLCDVFQGFTNKQIAVRAGVSEGAIKATLQQLFKKAHVRSRTQLVRIAVEGAIGASRGKC